MSDLYDLFKQIEDENKNNPDMVAEKKALLGDAYDDTPMPRKVGKHPALAMPYGTPDAPMYQRFVCMDGPFAGRGLIVQMPANRVLGYDLFKLEHGDYVAYVS